ncbi:MAG: hypothetical protein M9938_10710 [Solirubrobacterales bacterium]|nr:hypothetical protein [Solirubrobacterales bacterium]
MFTKLIAVVAACLMLGLTAVTANASETGSGSTAVTSGKRCVENMFGGPIVYRRMTCKRAQNLYGKWWHIKYRRNWKPSPYSAIRVDGFRCWIKKYRGKQWVSHLHCKKGRKQMVSQWGEGSQPARPGDLR